MRLTIVAICSVCLLAACSSDDDSSSGQGASGSGGSTQGAGGSGTSQGGSGGAGGGSAQGAGGTAGSGGGSSCGSGSDATTDLDAEEQAFLVEINAHRKANGAAPLTACRSLSRAAQRHSEDMRDQNYFDHSGLDGSSPGDRACKACFDLSCKGQAGLGENIAAGSSTGKAAFGQWKGSAGHNKNMLNTGYTQIGIGRATGGGKFGVYWTTVFSGKSEASCN